MTILVAALLGAISSGSSAPGSAGSRRFLAIRDFSRWTAQPAADGSSVYTSPNIGAGLSFNELVASWNVGASSALTVEAQAVYPERATKWYCLGRWSDDAARGPRESVTGQKDEDGDVQTDILVLKKPASRLRLRITRAAAAGMEPVSFLGLSFVDARASLPEQAPQKRAWGEELKVPERSQLSHLPEGKGWCSPASMSMVLAYWSRRLGRPELDRDVPLVAAGVDDPKWPGTGNWPFNTAFAGSLPGMRAYVTRLGGLRDLEEWVGAGVPVVCSISYRLLYNLEKSMSSGHVVVCTGFTREGDAIINDPWADFKKGDTVRQVIPRERMTAAWANSKNTVYLVYPIGWKIPSNREGRWVGQERGPGSGGQAGAGGQDPRR